MCSIHFMPMVVCLFSNQTQVIYLSCFFSVFLSTLQTSLSSTPLDLNDFVFKYAGISNVGSDKSNAL